MDSVKGYKLTPNQKLVRLSESGFRAMNLINKQDSQKCDKIFPKYLLKRWLQWAYTFALFSDTHFEMKKVYDINWHQSKPFYLWIDKDLFHVSVQISLLCSNLLRKGENRITSTNLHSVFIQKRWVIGPSKIKGNREICVRRHNF